eukprot:COSAG05_NODE_579_length_8556_cov_44.773679_11_plen_59_part_00
MVSKLITDDIALLAQLTTAMTTSSDASIDLAGVEARLSPSDETRARALGLAIAGNARI